MKKFPAVLIGGVAALLTLNAASAAPLAPMAAPVTQLQLAHYYYHHHGYFPGAVVGGIIGGLLSGPAYYDYDYYGPPVYAGPPPAYGAGVAYCERRFRSYDPESGTYLGYDGYRHPCP